MAKTTEPAAAAIDETIRRHLDELRKPGVLTVRPGFEVASHQLSGKPAIVATVHIKRTDMPAGDRLPDHIEGIPVDVREATAHQRLRVHDPAAAALAYAFGRPETSEPSWPFEREMPSGHLLEEPGSTTQQTLAQQAVVSREVTSALAAVQRKPNVPYVPPTNAPLDTIETTATITASVSPDAGLATLETFLKGTTESLVVGMYDFTSGRILRLFETVLDGTKTLQMVLDNPAPNDTRDQLDRQTVQSLGDVLGGRSSIAWALSREDVFAAAWTFPFAYHIKVIVRDGNAVWLSSGNLNNSNEPDLTSPPAKKDRDWHVIVEDARLAKLFTAFLDQDFVSAKAHQAARTAEADMVADALAKLAAEANPTPVAMASAPASHFPSKVFPGVALKITPLLTPDTLPGDATKGQYLTRIVDLIKSATEKLYIQLQYIEASRGGDYEVLLQAIADRVAAGVDVRLIENRLFGEPWAEKMKSEGVDLTANIALQPNVHNKGFVVDSRTVVVSSQNFSPAGVRENRDAGLILENVEIARYFEEIFLSDWQRRAKPFVAR